MTSSRPVVAIAGWFGSGNFGDELLLHVAAEVFRDAGWTVTVLAAGPDDVRQRHGYHALPLPTRSGGFAGFTRVASALRNANLLVLGPGTIFQERSPSIRWPGTLPLFVRLAATARLVGSDVAIVGAAVREGITPAGAAALRLVALMSRDVLVRDEISAGSLGSHARAIGDLALAWPGQIEPVPESKTFLVSMRPLSAAHESELAHSLKTVVRSLQENGLAGGFMPMALGRGAVGEDDIELYRRYFEGDLSFDASHLNTSDPFPTVAESWFRLVSSQSLVIATRLHAALAGAMCGVPTVAIAYERKVREVFASAGLGEFVVGVDADAEQIMSICGAARSDRGRQQFAVAREQLRRSGAVIRQRLSKVAEATS